MTDLQIRILLACTIAAACAVISVFVVLRRWAFIGEGIAHAGFGGAGTAWILSLALPTVAWLGQENGIFAIACVFCLLVAMGIGYMTRREQVRSDTAIGISLVASLAWGFVGYYAYAKIHNGMPPPNWGEYVLGATGPLGAAEVSVSIVASFCVLIILGLVGKEILAYCFDPMLAEVSGVRVGSMHYLLITLVTITILVGMRLMGSLLVTALLVLPGAAALQVSRNLRPVLSVSVVVGLLAAVAGPLISSQWRFVPAGPAIVLVLVLEFVVSYGFAALTRRNVVAA